MDKKYFRKLLISWTLEIEGTVKGANESIENLAFCAVCKSVQVCPIFASSKHCLANVSVYCKFEETFTKNLLS